MHVKLATYTTRENRHITRSAGCLNHCSALSGTNPIFQNCMFVCLPGPVVESCPLRFYASAQYQKPRYENTPDHVFKIGDYTVVRGTRL